MTILLKWHNFGENVLQIFNFDIDNEVSFNIFLYQIPPTIHQVRN
jgi:hypothetical protein